jgi:hypothetical protein
VIGVVTESDGVSDWQRNWLVGWLVGWGKVLSLSLSHNHLRDYSLILSVTHPITHLYLPTLKTARKSTRTHKRAHGESK